MYNWWQSIIPEPVVISIAGFPIYWYGVIMVISITAAYLIFSSYTKRFSIHQKFIDDLSFYTIGAGVLGARIYEVLVVNPSYYLSSWFNIINIRGGGLAIHGALIGAMIMFVWYAHYKKMKVPILLDCAALATILGQVIGRWGNFFNQELYGYPTELPWAIQIDPDHRLIGYRDQSLYHPTFIYESLLNLILFFVLRYFLLRADIKQGTIFSLYLIGYACIRISLEFVRIDPTTSLIGIRTPILTSLLMIIGGIVWYVVGVRGKRVKSV